MQVSKQSVPGATRVRPAPLAAPVSPPKSCVEAHGSGLSCRTGGVTMPYPPTLDRSSRDPEGVELQNNKKQVFTREDRMRSKLMLSLTASAAVMLFDPTIQEVWAQDQAALSGTVSSEAEGNMEGVVVTAKKPGSIVQVSVTTDAQGRYSFPENRLDPGEYAISIRAVGYDIASPAKAMVEPETTTTTDIKLQKTKKLARQLTNAERMMSIPGTEEHKA